jgi:ATP-dependent DNA helicase RecG
MMAPTEILAEHCRSCRRCSPPLDAGGLLTGSNAAGEKKRVYPPWQGRSTSWWGPHALLSGPVAFRRCLVVADEQHRFGVEQRAALAAKANTPDCPPEAGRRLCGEGRENSVSPAVNGMDGVPTAACRCGEVEQRAALAAKGEKKIRPHVLVMSGHPHPPTLALSSTGTGRSVIASSAGPVPGENGAGGGIQTAAMSASPRADPRAAGLHRLPCIETDPESAAADLNRGGVRRRAAKRVSYLRVGLVPAG